ncbi:MAG TPA: SRPBCC family protein [Thermoleophilaceae bacterium]
MAQKHAEHQIVIQAAPQACFDALIDYESFPDWQSAVKACEVRTRDGDGRGREVAFEIDARVRTVSYTLRYSYEPPHRIGWDYVDGDVRDVDGEYIFEDRGDGTTLATYSLALDPGVWLPGKLARVLSEQVMKGQMEELRDRVESSPPSR